MNNDKSSNYKNLYIDESGYYYLGQNQYRFFLLSATVIDPFQKDLADKLFMKWRQKNLVNPYRCMHASEFFEDRAKNNDYKRPQLLMTRLFNDSVRELLDLIGYINFESEVYYVDLPKLREKLQVPNPPELNGQSKTDKRLYQLAKHEYSRKLKITFDDTRFVPLPMTIRKSFDFHSEILNQQENNNKSGYINLESQSVSDTLLINIFHKYKNLNYVYGKNIIGINLHTKRSLDAGIELADFITYISCQTLRFKFKLNEELLDIPPARHSIIQEVQKNLRLEHKIRMVNVTDETFDPTKKAS